MNGIIMAGGLGSRMGKGDKLLIKYGGKPVALRVLDAMRGSPDIDDVYCATSPNAPQAAKLLAKAGAQIIETSGDGYSADLADALELVEGPVFVCSADMPLIDSETVSYLAMLHVLDVPWTSYVITKQYAKSLGIIDGVEVACKGVPCYHTGVMTIDAELVSLGSRTREKYLPHNDKRVAINLNTKHDCYLAGLA